MPLSVPYIAIDPDEANLVSGTRVPIYQRLRAYLAPVKIVP